MMNFIGADGQFINLAAIVVIDDVSSSSGPKALLTTIVGAEIEIDGPDAENLFNRIELLAMETEAASMRLREIIAAQGAQP